MKSLEMLIANPAVEAIGWTLLHSLWEGATVAAVLGATLLILRTARARYLAACTALFALLALFSLTLVKLAPESTHSFPVRDRTVPVWSIVAVDVSSAYWRPNLAVAAPWLALLWMAGVLLMFGRHSMSCIAVRRFRRRGVCCASNAWQGEVETLTARLRISRPVRLLESCLAESPTVIGHFRPLILMPVGMLAGLSPSQIESILLHELAHIRRHDYLINTLQRYVEGLFFYHPAAWWISAVIRTEREHCCDDLAVSILGDPHEYAGALAALEQSRGSQAAVAATGGSLVKRIHRLLYPRTTAAWAPFLAVLILVLTGAATVGAWPAKSSQSNAVAKQPETERALEPAYSKWLHEDVAYIIDQAERATFLTLATNEERDKFIEQFWERRNPSPGAPNKFKEEHYRRLAYANGHFASGVPGWQTDRGHIYILYGPPDEKESHPRAAGGSTETWLYHHVSGVGDNATITFVDSTGRGDFRLSPGAPFVPKSSGPGGKQA
jgi:GWxTD domain-containing protein